MCVRAHLHTCTVAHMHTCTLAQWPEARKAQPVGCFSSALVKVILSHKIDAFQKNLSQETAIFWVMGQVQSNETF